MKIIIIIGIVFLGLNILRFLLGNYSVLKHPDINWKMKVWNVFESLLINGTLIYLIWYWAKH